MIFARQNRIVCTVVVTAIYVIQANCEADFLSLKINVGIIDK